MLQGSQVPPMPKVNYIGVEHHLPNGRIDFVDAGHLYIEENLAGTLALALPFLTSG